MGGPRKKGKEERPTNFNVNLSAVNFMKKKGLFFNIFGLLFFIKPLNGLNGGRKCPLNFKIPEKMATIQFNLTQA